MSNSLSIKWLTICHDRSTSPLKRWQGGDAPAFVGIVVLRGGTDGESWHFVEEEIQAMVVVKNDDHIRFDFAQPIVNGRKAVEKWFPIRLLLNAFVDGTPMAGMCDVPTQPMILAMMYLLNFESLLV